MNSMTRIVGLSKSDVESLASLAEISLSKMWEVLDLQSDPSSLNEEHWIRLLTAFPLFALRTDIAPLKEDLAGRERIADTWKAARERMKEIPVPEGFKPLEATVIEKRGKCKPYELGDRFKVPSPFYWPRPCSSAWLSTWPYVIAAGFGYKSWEEDDSSVFKISCPSKKGVVFEIRSID